MQEKRDFSMSYVSPANGTDDREAHPGHWHVAFTRSNAERTAAASIRQAGFTAYVPSRIELRQWSDRKKRVEVMLIPRVVFVKAPENRLNEILRLQPVTSLLKVPGKPEPARIPDKEMEHFIFMVGNADTPVTITPPSVAKGERVAIIRGSLKGLEGLADEDSDGMRRITIRLDNLCCASVSVPITDIAPA